MTAIISGVEFFSDLLDIVGRFFDTTVSIKTGDQLRPFSDYEARLDFMADTIVNEYEDKCEVTVFVFADKIEVQIFHPYGQLTETHSLDDSKDATQFSVAVAKTYDNYRNKFC